MNKPPIGLLVLLVLQAPLAAQDLEIVTKDGRRVSGAVTALSGEGEEAVLELAAGPSLPVSEILELHGSAPRPAPGAIVDLVGGDQLRGILRAGDVDGETFVVESAVLGRIEIEVDRLREMVLRPAVRPEDLRVPENAEQDEAVFLPTPSSRLDSLTGVLHRFTDSGVLFGDLDAEPRLFAYQDLAGVALREGFEREDPAPQQVITSAGDSLGCELLGIAEGRFRIELEGEQVVELRAADIAALTFRGEGWRFLSDLVPDEVEESSYFGDGDEPLYPYRTDRTVTGNFLVAGEHTFGKGLGVHSRSRLGFRVPEGFARFFALVAVDEEVKDLGLRADVDVRVLVGEVVAFEKTGLRSGIEAVGVEMLDVQAGDLVTLEVDYGKGLDLADRVDWLLPVFLR